MKTKLTQRTFWGKKNTNLPLLDFLAVQKESYQWFLEEGIINILKETEIIEDFTGKNWALSFVSHRFDSPQHAPSETQAKGISFDAPLRVSVRLENKRTGEITNQEVFLGDIPQMTNNATFIINGVERCIVNQLVRSPGVFFSGSIDPASGRMLHAAELRPLRGSWLEFNVARNDTMSLRIDRHRKFAVTTLLRAVGFSSDEEILKLFESVDIDPKHSYIQATLAKDPTKSREEALIEIYEKMRPGEPAILENAQELIFRMFFDPRRYDLGRVGRYKLNRRLSLKISNAPENQVLTPEDLITLVQYLCKLQNDNGKIDDIDSLSNRRVRRVGELVAETAFRQGVLRLERSIREKMSLAKSDQLVVPSIFINPRPVIASINEFFRRNRLSTILDQTNPLAELDNLRRLSVMGPGGVTRERASFSMRDINSSQYSRICPVRSPEGPNIGLVTYLALYARVNKYGFLEAPYYRVKRTTQGGKVKMKVTDEIIYLQSDEEEEYVITHAGVKINTQGYIEDDWVPVRHQGEFFESPVGQVQFIDVVPRQVVGTSASLIPFLAHDEANRALMGTHMQCQAVPLVKPQAPFVGTGMETAIPEAMGRVVKALCPGEVVFVDAQRVEVKINTADKKKIEKQLTYLQESVKLKDNILHYQIKKYERSAQSTCYSQRPLVEVGQKIKKGQLLIDGPACDHGELALGQNLLIAYSSFEGLGYEDAIIISSRLVKEDLLTSIHVNEYGAEVMDTKLGPEELTRDIPNVSETDLANLTSEGIVAVGSEVNSNDILVGKIAPKGETELTAEERLLRAIFGEKAREVRDTSLKMPHGESGTVIEVRILDRSKGDDLNPGAIKKVIIRVAKMRKIAVGDKLAGRHGNKGVISKIVPEADMPYLADGTAVDIIISPLSVLARMNLGQLLEAHLGLAIAKLGDTVALPVFEPVSELKIINELKRANLPTDGKAQLYDGQTGEPFEEKTVVGLAYILKLVHMVEDKIHARSTGPYSLVTQQPLGGKAQMGGQRLGEMEVWALEAHRAAYTLQEMLTIKSDDVLGRAKAFEAIVKGIDIPEPNIPESFRVLVKELNSLSLNIIPVGAVVSDQNEEELELDTKTVSKKKVDKVEEKKSE
ncbi:DNA-directed RNA polymerase subunit beta [Patescibacteria group bacterium]|nr:DNA-directed RNA polymerase subunit beta [Patescibacteria group bacterium]